MNMKFPVGLHGTQTYGRQLCMQTSEKKTFNHVYTLAWEKKNTPISQYSIPRVLKTTQLLEVA